MDMSQSVLGAHNELHLESTCQQGKCKYVVLAAYDNNANLVQTEVFPIQANKWGHTQHTKVQESIRHVLQIRLSQQKTQPLHPTTEYSG